MFERRRFFLPAFLVLSAFAGAHAAAALPPAAPARPLITQAIDPGVTSPLAGNTRPEALDPGNDRGPVADDFALPDLLLQLRRPVERETALAALIEAQHDANSPYFRQWLTDAEFAAQFGPAQQDLDSVVAWLQGEGFRVDRVYESGMTIGFSGNAGLVRRAFATDIHKLVVDGQVHYANVRDPRIPAALAPAVHGIVALHDFKPRPQFRPQLAPDYTISASEHAVVPADLATIYNLKTLFNAGTKGQGLTIALIEQSDVYSTTDVSTFRSTFGLGSATFTQAHPSCSDPGAVVGDDGEATLDVEWAAAAAPGATLELVSCPNLSNALANLVNQGGTPPSILSISYGSCEAALGASGNAFFTQTYQQAVAKGMSVFVSSGDEGAAGCFAINDTSQAQYGIGVNGLASTPYNVAVGGTDFGDTYAGTTATFWNASNTSTYASAKSYINEIPWNDSCASKLIASAKGFAATYGTSGFCNSAAGANYLTIVSASGGPSGCATGTPSTPNVVGGTCHGASKPGWQTLVGVPGDGVRDLPDVSLFAANGVWGHYYVTCFSDTRAGAGGVACSGAPSAWAGAGGTSFSAPILAGIQALVNQQNGITLAGNPNPVYYQLAAAEYGAGGSASCNSSQGAAVGSSCIFYDVTQGDIDVDCQSGSPNCYRPSATYGVLSTSTSSYQPAYASKTGWDFATGIGSVNAANLAANWPLPTQLKFTTEPVSGSAGAALATIRVSVENAGGTVIAGNTSSITLTLGSNPGGATLGGTTTASAVNGVATFSNLTINKLGNGYTLVASASGLAGDTSSAFNIGAGAAAKLAFTTQPPGSTTSGANFLVAVTVQDALGNTVTSNSSAVTLALTNANGATLSGTKTLNAFTGVAQFPGLSIDKAGSYTLTATDGALTAATSSTITVAHGAAAKLAFTAQPPASVTSGATFGATVTVQDAAGNTVTGNGSSVGVALTNANGATLGGTTSLAASNGIATFSGLSVDKAGSYTLTATDGSLTSATSSTITIAVGSPSRLAFTAQPPSSLQSTTSFGALVAVQDAAGNTITGNGSSVTIALTFANGATLSGSKTLIASNGVASFGGLSIDRVGSYTLTATASGLTSAASNSIAITLGPATQIVFTTQPVGVVAGDSFAVAVAIEDAGGNVESADSGTGINLRINACGNALLANATASAGVAAFSDLVLLSPAGGRQLQAATASLSGGSALFAVTSADTIFGNGFDGCVP